MSPTTLSSVTGSVLGQPSVLVIFAASASLLGLLGFGLAHLRRWRRVPATLAGVSLALALAVTQGRQPFEFGGLDFSRCVPTSSGSGLSETLLNVGMLMPLGLFAACATRRVWGPVLFCVTVAVLTEACQAAFDTGMCVGQDAAANTIGGALAAFAGWAVLRRGRREKISGARPAVSVSASGDRHKT